MWWQHKYIIIVLLLAVSVSSCAGFAPLHQRKIENQENITKQLAQIKINHIPGRLGQMLHGKLQQVLDPMQKKHQPHYGLYISLRKENIPLAIKQDREITRYNTVISANYQLKDIKTNKQVHSGTVQMVGGYDAIDAEYSTFVAEQSTTERIIEEMSEELKIHLTASLHRYNTQQ